MVDAELHVVVRHVVADREALGSLGLEPEEPNWGAPTVGSAQVDGLQGCPTVVFQEGNSLFHGTRVEARRKR